MRRFLSILCLSAFLLTAGVWIVQCYRPIVLHNTFSNDCFSIRPVTSDLSFCDYDPTKVRVVGSSTTNKGEYIIKVRKQFGELLPPEGQHRLVEFADGALRIYSGVTDTAPASLTDFGRYANRRFKITRARSYPLWPLLALLGALGGYVLLSYAMRRRASMLKTYRASVPRKRQVTVAFVLLALSAALYFVQLRRPIVIYNGFQPQVGEMGLDRRLNWDRKTIMKTCRAISTSSARPNELTISVKPDEIDTRLPSLGKHWVFAVGDDAIQLRSGTVSAASNPANPLWQARHVTDSLTVHASLPLWLFMLVGGVWFSALVVLPSRTYLLRKRRGLCLKCGYDIRASTEKCSECGGPAGHSSARSE